jgi:dihydrofolate reductase
MVNVIAAMDPSGLIGLDGAIPWDYPVYSERFKAVTKGNALIVGRHAYEALGLRGERTIILTRRLDNGCRLTRQGLSYVGSFQDAHSIASIHYPPQRIWVVGGGQAFAAALSRPRRINRVDITIVPKVVDPAGRLVQFPVGELERHYRLISKEPDPHDPRLTHRLYQCRNRSLLSK